MSDADRQKQIIFIRAIRTLDPGFGKVYRQTTYLNTIPLYVMERYCDYMFAEFDKGNPEPFTLFLAGCEKQTDAAVGELISLTLGESLLIDKNEKRYHDYFSQNAGPRTRAYLGVFPLAAGRNDQ